MAEFDFKNTYNEAFVRTFGQRFKTVHEGFDLASFLDFALGGLLELELKDRVNHLADALRRHLPDFYPDALAIVMQTLQFCDPPRTDIPVDEQTNSADFSIWPMTAFIRLHGLEHFEPSMEAMYLLTQYFSAEFAIRPFLKQHTEQTLEMLHLWAQDESEHVRRLVSEGSRTRLPWGERLDLFITDPEPVFALLEHLYLDDSTYVCRSVANSLNDMSKDHPDRVLETLARWNEDVPEVSHVPWLTKHALRTLIKQGNPGALRLLGFSPEPDIELTSFEVTPSLSLGEVLEIEANIVSTSEEVQNIVVDFIVHHVKKNGTRTPKVFKFKTFELAPGADAALVKKHRIKPISTRQYYRGVHRVELMINGVVQDGADFMLTIQES